MRKSFFLTVLISLVIILPSYAGFFKGSSNTTGQYASGGGGGGTFGPTAITNTNNDAYAGSGDASNDLDGFDADGWRLGGAGTPDDCAGLRWPSTGISQGATISSVTLEIYRRYDNITGDFEIEIYCEDEDAPADFSSGATVPLRTRTTAGGAYAIPDNGTPNSDVLSGVTLVNALQELVDRPSWNGTITFLLIEATTNNLQCEDVDTLNGDGDHAARLTVDYTE